MNSVEMPFADAPIARHLLEISPAPVAIIDRNRTVVFANSRLCGLLGFSKDEVVGRPASRFLPGVTLCDIVPPRACTETISHDHQFSNEADRYEKIAYAVTKDGCQIRVVIYQSVVVSPSGPFLLTHLVREAVEPVDRRALESERLDAIAQMVRGLAHESRNSLQKAVANLDLLELDLLRNAEHMQLTQRIRKSLSDLLEHYDEVRRYAEPVRIRPERVQLLQLCQLAFDEIAVQHDVFPHQLNVMSRAMHEDEIHVDREKVKLAFHHILENAIDAADDSARIDVSCSRVGARGIDSVNVTLHDHGCGFDEFSLKRAFEPFYTTKQRGTGLGLAICRRIVEAHGGSMMAANHPERGAVVLLSLPDQYSTPS